MSQQPRYEEKKSSPFQKGLLDIKQQIDKTLEKMKKDPNYTPERKDLDKFSAKALALVEKHHPTSSEQKNLLIAVIDLTEVPVMSPSMQRVAFEVALREASKNILQSLSK
jgi:hypothetical protein